MSRGSQVVNYINSTYGQTPAEDIMQDLYMIFFKLLRRYKPMGKNFGAYLCTSFVYELARHVRSYLKDPITRCEKITSYYDEYISDSDGTSKVEDSGSSDMISMIDDIDFSRSWIMGVTCSEEFTDLTAFERSVLVKYYIEDKTVLEIAKETGFKRNSINRKRANAIEKVKNKMAQIEHNN